LRYMIQAAKYIGAGLLSLGVLFLAIIGAEKLISKLAPGTARMAGTVVGTVKRVARNTWDRVKSFFTKVKEVTTNGMAKVIPFRKNSEVIPV
jgi:hypothetical protein